MGLVLSPQSAVDGYGMAMTLQNGHVRWVQVLLRRRAIGLLIMVSSANALTSVDIEGLVLDALRFAMSVDAQDCVVKQVHQLVWRIRRSCVLSENIEIPSCGGSSSKS